MRPRPHPVHSPGLLYRLWRALRGREQLLVRPAEELPLVTIACARGERGGAAELRAALEETWRTLPEGVRQQYAEVLGRMPPMMVVELRRRNPCTCLGHHHPRGTESRLARRLRSLSGVEVGELDLAWEAIQEWQPAPLAHTAAAEVAGPEAAEELAQFRFRLALLDVFLHELHHLAEPETEEAEIRRQSGQFYDAALGSFVRQHYGVEYGLRVKSEE